MEAEHGLHSPLDRTVVLLKTIVQISALWIGIGFI
jgi:hypothetical protein